MSSLSESSPSSIDDVMSSSSEQESSLLAPVARHSSALNTVALVAAPGPAGSSTTTTPRWSGEGPGEDEGQSERERERETDSARSDASMGRQGGAMLVEQIYNMDMDMDILKSKIPSQPSDAAKSIIRESLPPPPSHVSWLAGLRLAFLYVWADTRRHKRSFFVGLFTVFLVVFFISLMQNALSKSSLVFFRLAETSVGENDLVLNPNFQIQVDSETLITQSPPLLNHTMFNESLDGASACKCLLGLDSMSVCLSVYLCVCMYV
jgi:hypothetical protein